MNKTIKLSLLSTLIVGATVSWAATSLPDAAASALKTQVLPATCNALVEGIAIKQSANVAAAYECGSTHVGISTANWKGRGKYYQIHSGGGNPLEQNGPSADQGGKYATLADANTDTLAGANTARLKAESAT